MVEIGYNESCIDEAISTKKLRQDNINEQIYGSRPMVHSRRFDKPQPQYNILQKGGTRKKPWQSLEEERARRAEKKKEEILDYKSKINPQLLTLVKQISR